ncbi:restriction endonuclease subunit S [Pseudoxanthomonas mexicana]|uniref:restriction endonuclease subunit S n=1 Tax=Pseudoxanthomonas mexicana TaxID=128785 RepID=UPI0024E1D079|nr:restriction endonuclease subunit S [Pseudoxanthomonas mexicana]
MRLEDFVDINPRTPVQRGVECEFVEMANITPGQRYVRAKQTRAGGGSGSKFLSGDVLMARITPCLENGKIAQFISNQPQAAQGSTEFWVFRAKPEVSDPAYVFYLACTDSIRGPAEKSMAGASGRQRADVDAVRELEVSAPPIEQQRRIASILSAYDDLIENNTRRIAILEEMARRIYEEWFVRFRFPGHENVPMVESELGLVPERWPVVRLDDVLVLQRGFDLPKQDRTEGPIPIVSATGVSGSHHEHRVQGPGVVTGRSGSLGTVIYVEGDFWPLNTTLWVKDFRVGSPLYAYYVLTSIDLAGFNSGAAVPTLNRNDVHGLPVVRPPVDLLRRFDEVASPMIRLKRRLELSNIKLRDTRDLLLPKLISGELDVSAMPEPEAAAA